MVPRSLLLSLLAALSLGACGDGGDSPDSEAITQTTPLELRGRWKSSCSPSILPLFKNAQREYAFNALGDFDRYERFYSDAACENLVAEHKIIGLASVPEAAEDLGASAPRPIDFIVNDVSLKLSDVALVNRLNAEKLCGRTDWQAGEEVLLLDTSGDCFGPALRKGALISDIYDVREGQLYFGKSLLFLAPTAAEAGRPKQLNTAVAFAKEH